MPIAFKCKKPQCGAQMQAPNVQAGRQVKCHTCGTLQTVPAGQGATIAFDAAARAEPVEEQAVEVRPFRSAGVIQCGQCSRKFPITEQLCPDCGWVNAELLHRLGPPKVEDIEAACPRLRPVDLLTSPLVAFTCMRGLLVMVMIMLLQVLVVQGMIIHANAFAAGHLRGFFMLAMMLESVFQMIVCGYVLRYYLNAIVAVIVGTGVAPRPMEIMFRTSASIGMRGVELVLVYVTPVVTLPLLPLAVAALSQREEGQALDLRWALKTAARFPLQLVTVWAFILIWLTGMACIIWFLWPLASGEADSMLVGFLMCIVVPSLLHPLFYACSHCIGLLVRACPEIVDSMPPERSNRRAELVTLLCGLAVTIVFWGWALPAIAG